jgi:hypothetical protein
VKKIQVKKKLGALGERWRYSFQFLTLWMVVSDWQWVFYFAMMAGSVLGILHRIDWFSILTLGILRYFPRLFPMIRNAPGTLLLQFLYLVKKFCSFFFFLSFAFKNDH